MMVTLVMSHDEKFINPVPDHVPDHDHDNDNNVIVHLPVTHVKNSVLFSDIINQCGTTQLLFPYQFNDVFNQYINYSVDIDDHIIIKRCLAFSHYIEDDHYLSLLIKQLLLLWSREVSSRNYIGDLSLNIADLNYDLRMDIYIQLPYHFLPRDYVKDNKLFGIWCDKNKDSHRTVAIFDHDNEINSKVYKFDITNSDNGEKQIICHIFDYYKIENTYIHGINRIWYISGRLKEESVYCYDTRVGACITYSDDNIGHFICEEHYLGGQLHGASRIWSSTPEHTLICEHYYENGIPHGTSKTWYPDTNDIKHIYHYQRGSKSGPQMEYYITGKIKSLYQYTYGCKVSQIRYDEKGNITYDSNSQP